MKTILFITVLFIIFMIIIVTDTPKQQYTEQWECIKWEELEVIEETYQLRLVSLSREYITLRPFEIVEIQAFLVDLNLTPLYIDQKIIDMQIYGDSNIIVTNEYNNWYIENTYNKNAEIDHILISYINEDQVSMQKGDCIKEQLVRTPR